MEVETAAADLASGFKRSHSEAPGIRCNDLQDDQSSGLMYNTEEEIITMALKGLDIFKLSPKKEL